MIDTKQKCELNEDIWKTLRDKSQKLREEEQKREKEQPTCGRCKKPGHIAKSCIMMRKPTDKE
jgi:hypothetical protein